MADERTLELLDDYLTNRMSDQEQAAFEKKIQADPDLKREYLVQKQLVKGIRDARVAELKAMLSSVPVPAAATSSVAAKIAIGTAVALLVVIGTLWYTSRENIRSEESEPREEVPLRETPVPLKPEPESDTAAEADVAEEVPAPPVLDKNQKSAGAETTNPSQAKKPAPVTAPGSKAGDSARGPLLDVLDPSRADSARPETETGGPGPASVSGASALVVETDPNNGRYGFHYRFSNGKLVLFGPFEKNLYEILEFFSDEKRTVFLFYRDSFYLLEERDARVRPLRAITDAALLKKLKEYRATK